MLKFLKNLFKEKEIVKERVELEKLFDWFTDKTKDEVQEINQKIQQHAENLNHQIKQLQGNLLELEKVVPDPKLNIQERVKQVVCGHRKNYITRLNLFIERIMVPETLNYVLSKERSL